MKINKIAGIFGGIAIGVVNGLLGGGGGMIAVPILQSVYAQTPRYAHATAIAVVLPVCVVSAFVYLLSGKMDNAVLIPTAIGSVMGGIVGAKLLLYVPERILTIAFFLIMLLAGFKMIGI